MKRVRTAAVVALLILVSGVVAPGSAFATGFASGPGTVRVTIATPEGIPASVRLSAASTYVAAKAAAGTRAVVPLQVDAGVYQVVADPMTVDGRLYMPTTSIPVVPVQGGRTADVRVIYTLEESLRDFRIADVTQTMISLTWTVPSTRWVTVRRTTGSAPARLPIQGTAVPVRDGVATDSGLASGAQYTYSLFAEYRGRLVGPMVVRVATVSTEPGQAAYVANQQTLILGDGDVQTATPTGSGVRVVLATAPTNPAVVVGAAVVLPVSVSLPGGYLGVVTAVAPDGRTLDLVAGGILDAFDYYSVSVPEFTGGDPLPAESPAAASGEGPEGPVQPSERETLDDAESVGPQAAAAASLLECKGEASGQITYSASLALAGHFNATISKYSIFGKDIPTGASLDMAAAATVSGAATVKTSGDLTCSPKFAPVLVSLSQAPVPLSFYFEPVAQFTVGGAVEASNIGLAVTAGVEFEGHIGLTDGASFSGSPIFSAVPLTPTVVASGSIGLKVGGQAIVGPGAGTPSAGVIAGVGGELNPIDASLGPVFPMGDPRYNVCLRASAAFTRSLYLVAKAWLGKWAVSRTVTFDALEGRTDYPGSPWYLPSGCQDAAEPGDTVLGDGVTKVDDVLTGDGSQWGYLPGFVPGKKTWVLSTGNTAEAVGDPATFASTSLGGPGDADLNALSGRQTYDAVAYSVTLIPTGSTLHVRYVFASEEYPEYVGSSFNDVMAVFVNGANCALVPGTTDPVSINTVNAGMNSAYYVDNTTGASGYGTTMDGLTTPLECQVPVQIGQPTTVKITVADASDQIYDSAVALLDQGIWSD